MKITFLFALVLSVFLFIGVNAVPPYAIEKCIKGCDTVKASRQQGCFGCCNKYMSSSTYMMKEGCVKYYKI